MARGVQVESLWNGILDTNGQALSGGKVYTYIAGTSTLSALYTDVALTTPAANPIVLDSNGQAQVYGNGTYKFLIKTSADVLVYTRDNLVYETPDDSFKWGGTSTGASGVFAITPSPAPSAYADGQRYCFRTHQNSAAGNTLNVAGLGAVPIYKGANAGATAVGDFYTGQILDLIYDSSSGGRMLPTNGTDFIIKINGSGETILSPSTIKTSSSLNLLVNTSDGADNGFQQFGHGTNTRGAYLILAGNEHATVPGNVIIRGGDVAGASVSIGTTASESLILVSGNTVRWVVNGSGDLYPDSTSLTLGTASKKVGAIFGAITTWSPIVTASGSMTIGAQTINQADYWKCGAFYEFQLSVTLTLAGTASNYIKIPFALTTTGHNVNCEFPAAGNDGGGTGINDLRWRYDGTDILVFKAGLGNFSLGAAASVNIQGKLIA